MSYDEIKAALAAATPGPWYWRNTQDPMLMGGRAMLVMSFERMGMQGAQPLFRDGRNIMQPGGRANLNDFPDAHLIANAPTWLAALLAEVDRLTRWRTEMLEVLRGLQELGKALGLPLGEQITGQAAVVALQDERESHGAAIARAEAAEQAVQRVRALAYDWRHQPTNSDTEQQIADGTSILRALDGGDL